MSESAQVILSAASLTAEEVAKCHLRGTTFTDLVILLHADGESFGRVMSRVSVALDAGAPVVWLLEQDTMAISIFPACTHLSVVRGDKELAPQEFPLFRCRVAEFYRLLGIVPQAPTP